jgi:hypothetical protein
MSYTPNSHPPIPGYGSLVRAASGGQLHKVTGASANHLRKAVFNKITVTLVGQVVTLDQTLGPGDYVCTWNTTAGCYWWGATTPTAYVKSIQVYPTSATAWEVRVNGEHTDIIMGYQPFVSSYWVKDNVVGLYTFDRHSVGAMHSSDNLIAVLVNGDYSYATDQSGGYRYQGATTNRTTLENATSRASEIYEDDYTLEGPGSGYWAAAQMGRRYETTKYGAYRIGSYCRITVPSGELIAAKMSVEIDRQSSPPSGTLSVYRSTSQPVRGWELNDGILMYSHVVDADYVGSMTLDAAGWDWGTGSPYVSIVLDVDWSGVTLVNDQAKAIIVYFRSALLATTYGLVP